MQSWSGTRIAIRLGGPALPRAFAAALAALAAALVLGLAGPMLPGARDPLAAAGLADAIGLVFVAGAGALAHLLARLTAEPVAPADAALAAAFAPVVLVPGLGVGALLVPLTLSLVVRGPGQRVVALMVQCTALAVAAAAPASGSGAALVCAIMPGIAWVAALRGCRGAANDNPSMERMERFDQDSKLLHFACYARADSIPGKWGVS